MEETVVLQQRPELAQRVWRWRETANGRTIRSFDMNFVSGAATASKVEKGETKHWSDTLDVEPGRTFAGFGFTMAAKALRDRLVKGETVELKAVGFTPSPKTEGRHVVRGPRHSADVWPSDSRRSLRCASGDSSDRQAVREGAGRAHLADAAAGRVPSLRGDARRAERRDYSDRFAAGRAE
jgi:hypothetical protein